MFRFSGQPTVYIAPSFATTANNLPSLPYVNGLNTGNVSQIYTPPAPASLDTSITNLATPTITSNLNIVTQYLNINLNALYAPLSQAVTDCILI